jgi:hypothetical protein
MNDALLAKCASIFDSVLTSPLGSGVLTYLSTSAPKISRSICAIRDSLDDNRFPTVSDWIHDVQHLFQTLARDFGVDTDIGLSLLTLLQMIEDAAVQLTPNGIDIDELDQVILQFQEIAANAPNSLSEFAEAIAETPPAPTHVPTPPQTWRSSGADAPALDTYAIYQDVIALKTDQDLEKIVDIVSRFETSYAHVKDVIEIDLTRCQPETLQRIHNYIKQVSRTSTK